MEFLNKLVLVWSLLVAVAPVIKSETKGLIELKYVRAGATVNRFQSNQTTIEVFDSIFDKNSSYPEVYKRFTEFIRYPPIWRSRQFDCLDSIDLISHPVVKTTNKFSSDSGVDRSFLHLEEDLFMREKLNIDNKFKNSNYTCVLYELCNLKEERIKQDVKVINKDDSPIDDNIFNLDTVQKAVFRIKKGNETDYVTSITTGTCLAQVYAYEKDSLKEKLLSSYDDKKIVFKSPLVSATNNTELEKWTEDFLEKIESSLLNFENLPVKNQTEIFKRMESNAVRDFRLISLLTLGDKLMKSSWSIMNLQELLPGHSVNLKELKEETVLAVRRIKESYVEEIFSSKFGENLGIKINTRNNEEKIKSSCPFERLIIRSSDNVNSHQDLEFFDCLVEKKRFGIPEYLKKEYKRIEVKVCVIHKSQSLQQPLTVINWHKDFQDIGYNVFMNENIIIQYPNEGETHYVTAVYIGDCLYQAFVYNASDNIDTSEQIYNGQLISGSGNATFMNEISELLLNTENPKKGLYQVLTNETLKFEMIKKFRDNYVLSVNLRSMRTKRPLPQVDLIEHYFNFGNSLQASLVTIFVAMIAAKLLIN